jgi:hypothetical protein
VKRLAFAVSAVSAVLAALPAQSKETTVLIGAGMRSCGTWTNTIGMQGHIEYEAWVLGFLSSFNMFGLSINGDVSRTTDGRGVLGWMDTYCANHPLDQISTGAVRLIEELQRRSGAR